MSEGARGSRMLETRLSFLPHSGNCWGAALRTREGVGGQVRPAEGGGLGAPGRLSPAGRRSDPLLAPRMPPRGKGEPCRARVEGKRRPPCERGRPGPSHGTGWRAWCCAVRWRRSLQWPRAGRPRPGEMGSEPVPSPGLALGAAESGSGPCPLMLKGTGGRWAVRTAASFLPKRR